MWHRTVQPRALRSQVGVRVRIPWNDQTESSRPLGRGPLRVAGVQGWGAAMFTA